MAQNRFFKNCRTYALVVELDAHHPEDQASLLNALKGLEEAFNLQTAHNWYIDDSYADAVNDDRVDTEAFMHVTESYSETNK